MRFAVMLSVLLSACGATDVATTAAANAKLQAEQAKQGKETMDKVQSDLSAAMKAGEERAAAADSQR